MKSLVLIIPDALRSLANALGEALDEGDNSFSVPLSPGGTEPATHWGLHTWASDGFLAMLESGQLPPGVEYPQADLAAVLAGLIASVREDFDGHVEAVLAAQGLAMVRVEDEL